MHATAQYKTCRKMTCNVKQGSSNSAVVRTLVTCSNYIYLENTLEHKLCTFQNTLWAHGFTSTPVSSIHCSSWAQSHTLNLACHTLYTLTSHKWILGLTHRPGVIHVCGLSLLLLLYMFSALRGFSLETLVFPSPQKLTFPNSNSILNCTGIPEWVLGPPWVYK